MIPIVFMIYMGTWDKYKTLEAEAVKAPRAESLHPFCHLHYQL